jgi:hypothetical protein
MDRSVNKSIKSTLDVEAVSKEEDGRSAKGCGMTQKTLRAAESTEVLGRRAQQDSGTTRDNCTNHRGKEWLDGCRNRITLSHNMNYETQIFCALRTHDGPNNAPTLSMKDLGFSQPSSLRSKRWCETECLCQTHLYVIMITFAPNT